jgi:hypothetical protein
MVSEYEHTQSGTLIRVMMGLMLVFFIVLGVVNSVKDPSAFAMLIPPVVLTICLALFHSLTVRVSANDIFLTFGIGLIQKSFIVGEIEQVSTTRTRWYHGWGIKKIWGGWLYNVSGFDVVQLTMKDGRIFLIGTDEPRELEAAIEAAMSSSGSR